MPDYALLPSLAKELEINVAELVEGKRADEKQYFLKENDYMTNYKILVEVNQKETAGEKITDKEKHQRAMTQLFSVFPYP